MTEKDIINLIKKDKWMMDVLKTAESLDLPDWWIGAGFIRDKVWDFLSGHKERTPLNDVDIIYFDKNDFHSSEADSYSTKIEEEYQEKLNKIMPEIDWSVTNQARMHLFHHTAPYNNSKESLSEWSETATCIGVRIEKDNLIILAPHGIRDLVSLIVRPNPAYKKLYSHDPGIFERRVKEKRWKEKWPKLKILTE